MQVHIFMDVIKDSDRKLFYRLHVTEIFYIISMYYVHFGISQKCIKFRGLRRAVLSIRHFCWRVLVILYGPIIIMELNSVPHHAQRSTQRLD